MGATAQLQEGLTEDAIFQKGPSEGLLKAPTAPLPPIGEARPETVARRHIEQCHLPEFSFAFDFMSDYLTMMDMLAKSITHELHDLCNITPLQYRILLRMLVPAPIRATQLAHDLDVGVSTISVALSKLADRLFVSRHDSARDMRSVELSLTKQGRKMIERADEAIYAVMAEYWSTLTQEQLEAAIISSLLAVKRHSYPRMENGSPRLDTALVDTVMISRRLTGHALKEAGLTINDYRILLALKIMGTPCPTTDVAKFLFLNASDITGCLKNLEGCASITRSRSEDNRRVRMIRLTPKGDDQVRSLLPVVFDALHETCHSSDALIDIHISAARDLVARRRQYNKF